jgi:hypothetical protein
LLLLFYSEPRKSLVMHTVIMPQHPLSHYKKYDFLQRLFSLKVVTSSFASDL